MRKFFSAYSQPHCIWEWKLQKEFFFNFPFLQILLSPYVEVKDFFRAFHRTNQSKAFKLFPSNSIIKADSKSCVIWLIRLEDIWEGSGQLAHRRKRDDLEPSTFTLLLQNILNMYMWIIRKKENFRRAFALLQIGHCYPEHLSNFPQELKDLLSYNHTVLDPDLRMVGPVLGLINCAVFMCAHNTCLEESSLSAKHLSET